MAAFIYRCPVSGYNVQAFVADDPSKVENAFLPMTCTACTRVHLVNPKTGKELSEIGAWPEGGIER
jgi:hypothetical protein